jgi:hypothetical protein
MTLFDQLFAGGGAQQLAATFGRRGGVVLHPAEGEPIPLAAIVYDEERRTVTNGMDKQLIRERAVSLIDCPCELVAPLRVKNRYKVTIDDVPYRIITVAEAPGFVNLQLEHDAAMRIANPNAFRQ